MSFWGRLFGKRSGVRDDRESTSLCAGDLAVCIRDDWLYPDRPHPEIGEVRRVVTVADVTFVPAASRQIALQLEAYGDWWFSARAFRKAAEDREPAEAEFTALIKRPVRKPKKVRA